jgi:hypothetical protein
MVTILMEIINSNFIEEICKTNTDNIKLHSPTTKSDELSFQSLTVMSMFMSNMTIPELPR